MKTEYKYIEFKKGLDPKTWDCLNRRSKNILCGIAFHPTWKQWVMETDHCVDSIFNNSCLLDIVDFINQLNKT